MEQNRSEFRIAGQWCSKFGNKSE